MLKVHHFLPANSYAQQMFIQPWCDKIAAESNKRMRCQIYPSMQLGGPPPQLVDQVRDGVVEVIPVAEDPITALIGILKDMDYSSDDLVRDRMREREEEEEKDRRLGFGLTDA